MKLMAFALLFLASCASTGDRAAYVNLTSSEFTAHEARDFDAQPGAEVGLLYGGEEVGDGRMVGLVSDVALRGSSGGDTWGGREVDIDSLGLRTGLRWYPDTGSALLQPFVGAGLLFQHTWLESDLRGDDADEFVVGFMGLVGLESQIGRARLSLTLGRTEEVEPEVDGEPVDLDATVLMAGVGWSF